MGQLADHALLREAIRRELVHDLCQMSGRRGNAVRDEDGIGKLEEIIGPTMEAFVERATKAVESVVGSHDAPILRSPRVSRASHPTRSKNAGLASVPLQKNHQDDAGEEQVLLIL